MGHSTHTNVVGVSSMRKDIKRPRNPRNPKPGLNADEERQKRAESCTEVRDEKREAKLDAMRGKSPKPKLSKEETKKQKEERLSALSHEAAVKAIEDFSQDEKESMWENRCSWSGSDDGGDSGDVFDRVQPPGAGSIVYVPLPPRASANLVLEKLQSARGDSKEAKNSMKWLSEKFGDRDATRFISAANEGYSGVVIPLSKAEAAERKKKGEKKTYFLVSFDYHH
jgi:hypothetical protein